MRLFALVELTLLLTKSLQILVFMLIGMVQAGQQCISDAQKIRPDYRCFFS